MATIKKNDFKRVVSEGKSLNEFVDSDGGIISGDERFNMGSEIKTGPLNQPDEDKGIATTTDDFASTSIQPKNWWWSFSYGQSNPPVVGNLDMNPSDTNLDESELTREQLMKNMVEDVLAKKSSNKDLVRKSDNNDVNRDNIPDISKLEKTKMVVIGRIKDFIDSINNDNLNGEELAIMLNYMLKNVKTTDIPFEYKSILKKLI
jgi:hypothetical protein